MFCLNDTMRYYLCPGRTDMRKGISSLCGVVHERMRSDVKNGDVFIFIGQSRRLMKLLHAEDGGMVMYVKRLETGRFKLPDYDESTQSYQMEWRDLVMMVEGIQESPEQRLRRLRAPRKEYAV
ncbi:MAG: IS66 family insertion sequence element accessory protein TnpB [Prevotella sp.]|nr:IS66 family insertion sequence element accessory protein TnpB [Prevotella sp.]